MDHNDDAGTFDQPSLSIRGTVYQAARDIVQAVSKPVWDFDTSLLVHGLDIGARFLLAAYAAYRLGYSRGLSAGHKETDRREDDT
jgi:hypothetical protein